MDIHASLAVVTFVIFPCYSLPFATSWICILPTPMLITFHSVCHSIRSSEVDMPCLFGRSLSTSLAGCVINHFCTQSFCVRLCRAYCCHHRGCHLLKLYVKCAALYLKFIPQSFWNTRCGRPRGRTFHLTRSLVALEGWSSVRDRINRKHCPSNKIWSYKRDGRWWGWSFDRGSTVQQPSAMFRYTQYAHIFRHNYSV